ncbi:enoyl-CoA hydratase-related protein [Rhizorhabdus dicambivorans]|uniref:Crotonase n=1 Tax=Rhizorhabdus dicambivorans TaxID=1850238 RepID=A0A2A4FSF4_9SPHN|nr:enoyl-CoA hydratase-related protein [Rhizorhabdus dicambivorans]ATE66429.1 crotonase [Rhizorhabdus dicambivorans]PCE41079.1 crotonase [Rhizorhabdus dicambivorans]
MEFLRVRLAESGVAHVVMARGPANAVNDAMYRELADLFGDIDRIGGNVRAVVLSAEGRHFCAGNDLDEFRTMTPGNAAERMWRVRETFFAITDCPVPVIGAIHGAALGAGIALAASCDFVVATPDSRFGLPELTVGVMGGARHLARIAPQPLVRRMFFTGEPLSGAEFAAAGAAVTIVEADRLMAEATRLAERIAAFSPTAVRVAKRTLDRVETMELRQGYRHEQGATERMSGHPDAKEALAAFLEKRAPHYRPRDRDHHWYGL